MSKNKLMLDLSGVELSEEQLLSLQKAVGKTIATQLGIIHKVQPKKKAPKPKRTRSRSAGTELLTKTARMEVKVFNTEPGKSEISADHNGNIQILDQSGTIVFGEVASGDIILIDVDSLGTTTLAIDISADPMLLSFGPGNGNGQFFIN